MFNDSSILVKQRKERDRIKSKIEIKVTKEGTEPVYFIDIQKLLKRTEIW